MLEQSKQTGGNVDDGKQYDKPGWKAQLNLEFVRAPNKTLLARRSHYGPLTVQRPFYPEGDVCHVYLLHPPGGMVAGDQLTVEVDVDKGAQALITTPGAGKVYRSTSQAVVQTVSLNVKQEATLEWLPQEMIVFEGARLQSDLRIDLEKNARFIGWEILALGRPAANEGFNQGEALLNWQIFREGEPLFLEKIRLDSQAFIARWGLNHCSSCGTLFAYGATQENLQQVRALIEGEPRKAVTLIDELLICRASADKTETVRRFFENVRALIRIDIVRLKPYTPRIWAT